MKTKIVFLGSSAFSISSLDTIIQNNKQFELVGVVTNKPSKKGRGMLLQKNIVHQFALERGLSSHNIFTPDKIDTDLINRVKLLDPDIVVVVSYGKILPKDFLQIAKIETINLHPSSLPLFRGAAPIERTIESGAENIDICIIKVAEKLDAGDIILRSTFKIEKDHHATDIIPRISKIGSEMIIEAINNLRDKKATYQQQGDSYSYAKKIEKSELLINPQSDVNVIYNKIRAFNAIGCYFMQNNKRIKILKAKYEKLSVEQSQIGTFTDNQLFVSNGKIIPLSIQKEGGNIIYLNYK
jgi:methionyl-tRNA formyltransferase